MGFLNQIKESFLEFLFPQGLACPACGDELAEGLLCPNCQSGIAPIGKPCTRCGRNMLGGGGYCSGCKGRIPHFDGCLSACEYDGAAKALLGRLKNGHRYAAEAIAALMLDALKGSAFEFDVVTCVPITPRVKRLRGYNQSLLLAQIIAQSLGKELDGESLIKARDTAFQKDLPASQRQSNIGGAFKLAKRGAFEGRRVLLVDDVMTTGSTLSECAKTLKKGGAQKVFCLTFASVGESVKLD
ncbi:MAG: ComF family protein [Clostridiales bacterium]|jgi:ComF family protein|nr:ComF family protein [Clostridiales bacterium]